jgi:aspartyl-tRNA(Asn)/glutamyl-tRNA(Gln) amidotransferase subunit A
MKNFTLTDKPITELATMIQKGIVSPIDLADAFLRQIETINNALKAYITVAEEKAHLAAQEATEQIRKGNYLGMLHGIPYACKDLFQTRDILTTGGSRVLAEWIPDTDADAIQKLNASGGVLLGKLNQHEFAYGATGENDHFGTVPNPWDLSCLAGGSSSGSAAAVAAGLAVYALGTDTGGSTRAPAALCGVVGLKPTYGRIALKGVIPYCWSLDHIGIFTRSTIDAYVVYKTLAQNIKGKAPLQRKTVEPLSDLACLDTGKLRIGIPRSFFYEKMDPEILESVKGVIREFEENRFEVMDIDMPPMENTRTVSLLIQLPEVLSYHSRYLPEKRGLYGEDMRGGMALGQFILAENYIRAKRVMQEYRLHIEQTFEDVDMIITPACPITAPKIGSRFITVEGEKEPIGNAITRFTSFFNLTGNPAISIPCGMHSNGLPMGVQLVGRHFEEDQLLKSAHFLEKQIGWYQKYDGMIQKDPSKRLKIDA